MAVAPGDLENHPALAHLQIVPVDLGSRLIPYREGWQLQRQVHEEVVAGRRPGTLVLLEHEAVFTAGSRTRPEDRPTDGSQVVDVDRGGRITWHGPGQLVGYPIVRLPQRFDVVGFVRAIEDLLIRTCARFGVAGHPVEGRSGVWVSDGAAPAKVAAIGVRVAQGTTMHGFAVNCDCDVSWAQRIVPCGIPDAGVSTLSAAAGRQVTVHDVARELSELLGSRR